MCRILLINLSLIGVMAGCGFVVFSAIALWRGDPGARLKKRRRKYIKEVSE